MEKSKYAKKKRCPRCGETKYKREFYKGKDGYSQYCKECERKIGREWYASKRKKPDGIFFYSQFGRTCSKQGNAVRIYWSDTMLRTLREHFSDTKNADLAVELGISQRTVVRKARELGLEKSPNFTRALNEQNLKLMQAINRCVRNRGMIGKGEHRSPETEFKSKVI